MSKSWTSIHFLRAAAASVVVAHHVPQYLNGRVPYHVVELPLGAAGVDVFFVISGFVMYCATYLRSRAEPAASSQQPKSWLDFLKQRLARVLPMYWLVTCALTLAVWLMPSAFATFRVSPGYAAKSLLFIPVFDANGYIRPVLAAGWTLSFELSFYALVAVCLRLFGRKASLAAALTLIVVALLGQLLALPERHSSWQLLSPIIVEFAFGVGLAHAAHSPRLQAAPGRVRIPCALLVGLAGALAGLWSSPDNFGERLLSWGVGSLAVVGAFVLIEPELTRARPRLRLLERLGDASYSMYLIHGVTFSLLWKLSPAAIKESPRLAFLVLALGPIVASIPVHRYVERPLTRWVSGLLRPRSASDKAASPRSPTVLIEPIMPAVSESDLRSGSPRR